MERAWSLFGDARYERLAAISVAHLYNLRKRQGYQRRRQLWTKTRPVTNAIGTRRAPTPNNRPGYLRLDSVHQGDQDGLKGIYHINAVDCVTQFEAVATCERLSEAYLLPVLEEILLSFPFIIRGFHSDNAQAESKNGSIVRKHFGYSHIPQRFAREVNDFCRAELNPYLNFHRPCLFPETITDAKGRQRKRYPYNLMMTPYEKFKSMPNAEQFLKAGISFQNLDALARSISNNDAAQRLNDARARLFKSISNRSKSAA
jgi:hypothetical protein